MCSYAEYGTLARPRQLPNKLTTPQPWRVCGHHPLGEHVDQARFANARLATEHHQLPVSILALYLALPQQAHLRLTAYQRREARGSSHVEATPCRALSQHLIDVHRRLNALEGLGPVILWAFCAPRRRGSQPRSQAFCSDPVPE